MHQLCATSGRYWCNTVVVLFDRCAVRTCRHGQWTGQCTCTRDVMNAKQAPSLEIKQRQWKGHVPLARSGAFIAAASSVLLFFSSCFSFPLFPFSFFFLNTILFACFIVCVSSFRYVAPQRLCAREAEACVIILSTSKTRFIVGHSFADCPPADSPAGPLPAHFSSSPP